jgi:Fe-S cluster biogenesis protein NfuA/nitrite reductase/ring-hydroxylating ferredoxin subunit
VAAVATAADSLVGRVQELTERLDALGDPEARACGEELAAAVVQLYGEGLERIFAALADDGASAREVRERLIADGVVSSLMLIHGLYPVSLERRVQEALDEVRPYLESHGGGVEVVALTGEGVAHLRLHGSCDGCSASSATLELAIRGALDAAAPDLMVLEVEGIVGPPRNVRDPPAEAEWVTLDGAAHIERGQHTTAGELMVANVAGTLLAYRDACAGCGAPLSAGALLGGTLTCASCGLSFDLPRAGRCTDGAGLQLAPVPLLRTGGQVRVALSR